jgi:hypothetical protein
VWDAQPGVTNYVIKNPYMIGDLYDGRTPSYSSVKGGAIFVEGMEIEACNGAGCSPWETIEL